MADPKSQLVDTNEPLVPTELIHAVLLQAKEQLLSQGGPAVIKIRITPAAANKCNMLWSIDRANSPPTRQNDFLAPEKKGDDPEADERFLKKKKHLREHYDHATSALCHVQFHLPNGSGEVHDLHVYKFPWISQS